MWTRFPRKSIHLMRDPVSQRASVRNWGLQDLYPAAIVALHQANYATISNYLERELRYMDAGERGSKAPKAGPQGTPGYQ